MTSRFCTFETAMGVCGVAWSTRGLVRVRLPGYDVNAAEERAWGRASAGEPGKQSPEIARCIGLLQDYFRGGRIDFRDVVLDFEGIDPFNARIYRALLEVGYGETTTYGALAKAVGEPTAARAVGVAMSRNPWPVIVPCHRVLASGGRPGGFSAPGGTLTKDRLLALEGAAVGEGEGTPLLPGLFGMH
jgi:methylated-DNA-[protein]-cysteine S-methyltransferase